MDTEKIYGKIYRIVSDSLNAADRPFEYSRITFLSNIGNHPQQIDISKYLALSNPDFFQSVYTAVYSRLPDQKTSDEWERKFQRTRQEFQRAFLLYVTKSNVAAINHIQFIHNPYFTQHTGIRYKALGCLYRLTDKSSLRELGKKLPTPIQNVIRKVFL